MSSPSETRSLVQRFLDGLGGRSVSGVMATLSEDVAHDVAGEGRAIGREAFERHLLGRFARRPASIGDVVILVSEDGRHASAEFTIRVEPGSGADGRGGSYRGADFFEVDGGLLSRVTEYVDADERDRQAAG